MEVTCLIHYEYMIYILQTKIKMSSIRMSAHTQTCLRLAKNPYRGGLILSVLIILTVWFFHHRSAYSGITDHCLSLDFEFVIPADLLLFQMSKEGLSCLYKRYVTSLQSLCTMPKRFGNIDYGGVRICVDPGVAPSKGKCVIYSYNHDLSDRFVKQIYAKYRCNVVFYGEGLVARKSTKILGLTQIVSNYVNEISVLILKITVTDFPFLFEMSQTIKRAQIKQIIFEIHLDESRGTRDEYLSVLKALRELRDSNYEIYWFDRNWEFVKNEFSNRRTSNCFTINMYLKPPNTSNMTGTSSVKVDLPKEAPVGTTALTKDEVLKYQERYARYILKHQYLCKQMVRLGNIVDGGWDVCHDVQFRPKHPCIVYSIGISWDFSFDEDIANTYGCDVFSFDPSMDTDDFRYSDRIMFYNVGLGAKVSEITVKDSKWKIKNLQTIMKELGHTDKRIDVLKIDIEGHERQSLPEIIDSGALKNVVQLCMETHSYYDLGTMRKLYEAGFRLFWAHQNPQAPLYTNSETLSYGMEVYFVNINLMHE